MLWVHIMKKPSLLHSQCPFSKLYYVFKVNVQIYLHFIRTAICEPCLFIWIFILYYRMCKYRIRSVLNRIEFIALFAKIADADKRLDNCNWQIKGIWHIEFKILLLLWGLCSNSSYKEKKIKVTWLWNHKVLHQITFWWTKTKERVLAFLLLDDEDIM